MANSMTGYGRGRAAENGRSVTIELRSVNHRFIEVNIKSSFRMFTMDDLVKKTIKERFSRGYFEALVTTVSDAGHTTEVSLNEAMLAGYVNAARSAAQKFGIDGLLTLGDILQLKELFVVAGQEIIADDWLPIIDKALNDALEQVENARAYEGENTLNDIKNRFTIISKRLDKIKTLHEHSSEEKYGKLKERIKKLVEEVDLDENRFSQEVALLVDKCDVSEELERLDSHLKQVDSLFQQSGPVGRKLEFFLQEINRETNTIGSKTASSDGTSLVVDIKSELEKIREQAQNLE